MTVYRRVVSGFTTLRLILDKLDKLLVRYQDKITVWVFDHTSAENTAIIVAFMNSVHTANTAIKEVTED